jgi:hypothetical protein
MVETLTDYISERPFSFSYSAMAFRSAFMDSFAQLRFALGKPSSSVSMLTSVIFFALLTVLPLTSNVSADAEEAEPGQFENTKISRRKLS